MQRTKTRGPVSLPACITDDDALGRLPRFDLQPRIAPLPREIKAVALFRDDALQTELLHRLKKCRPVFHGFTQPVRGTTLHGIPQPLAAAHQRLIHDWAAIEIKAVEEITDRRIFRTGA